MLNAAKCSHTNTGRLGRLPSKRLQCRRDDWWKQREAARRSFGSCLRSAHERIGHTRDVEGHWACMRLGCAWTRNMPQFPTSHEWRSDTRITLDPKRSASVGPPVSSLCSRAHGAKDSDADGTRKKRLTHRISTRIACMHITHFANLKHFVSSRAIGRNHCCG